MAKPAAKGPDTAALVTTLAASQQTPGQAMDPNLSQLLGVLARKMLREEAQLEQVESERKAQQEQGAKAMEQRRKAQKNAQEQCSHLKPWGGSALAGQRTHQHNTLMICQFCGKLFDGIEVPPHLRIPAERIGGPDN
jgi:hypothetical protein